MRVTVDGVVRGHYLEEKLFNRELRGEMIELGRGLGTWRKEPKYTGQV